MQLTQSGPPTLIIMPALALIFRKAVTKFTCIASSNNPAFAQNCRGFAIIDASIAKKAHKHNLCAFSHYVDNEVTGKVRCKTGLKSKFV